ncbi:DNA alkylation repair protein [Paenibacillus crassostreae]|uniref:DNA alkylation repair protein n=1 Tax=Paenibacillus crassostreae TaxID=1763538 RepID=A0A167DWL2_9BACL|nr:DNA alkylation repair protein [Paenibacillus crassostreae]AOZ90974.1 hypothetical protein LPB68_01325 [Paenibacillus crassostreae]OAB74862.1 hypothetical protein PNBC_12630 [Paenibacillus crassostreae]
MAEPLKDIYHETFLSQFGEKVKAAYDEFNIEAFVNDTLDHGWDELKLKERIRRITHTLGKHLPESYDEALKVLFRIDESCVGFPYLFFPDFVEVYGQAEEHWELSMNALERFTCRSSAEFAVRPFILRSPERMMQQMVAWAQHPNEHVRRLASEGCRPRLPWGQALTIYKKDPAPLLPVLELLKEDPALYVRKSVANNLNDIAKDHPAVVLDTARRWMGHHSDTDWIIRHGCRTLIRKAHPEILSLFGYGTTDVDESLITYAHLSAEPSILSIGDSCELSYELHILEGEPVRIRIEYGIDFVKARGQTSRKLFLLSDKIVAGGAQLKGTRTHHWADLSTRRHYPGEHRITLTLNGVEVAHTVIQLH